MSPGPRFVFFVNPRAGAGGGVDRFGRLRRRHPGALEGRVVLIEGFDGVRSEMAALKDAVPVAVGGDGTLNLMVRALRDTGRHGELPLGLLPLGTGNALAHSLGLKRMEAAIGSLHKGSATPIDALITTHPAAPVVLASLSFGFEARVMTAAARVKTWRRLLAGLSEATRSGPAESRGVGVSLDGRPWLEPDHAFFVAGLYNLRCYALGRPVFPEARLDDGLAEAALYPTALTYLAALAPRLIGPHRSTTTRSVESWRTAHVESPDPVQLDGESAPGGSFDVRLEPGAYRLLCAGAS